MPRGSDPGLTSRPYVPHPATTIRSQSAKPRPRSPGCSPGARGPEIDEAHEQGAVRAAPRRPGAGPGAMKRRRSRSSKRGRTFPAGHGAGLDLARLSSLSPASARACWAAWRRGRGAELSCLIRRSGDLDPPPPRRRCGPPGGKTSPDAVSLFDEGAGAVWRACRSGRTMTSPVRGRVRGVPARRLPGPQRVDLYTQSWEVARPAARDDRQHAALAGP